MARKPSAALGGDSKLIRRFVEDLVGSGANRREDREDLAQELELGLWQALGSYVAGRGDRTSFVRRVIRNFGLNILARDGAAKRGRGRRASLEREEDVAARMVRRRLDELEAACLALDLAEQLARLPAKLREFAEALREVGGVAEAARSLGIDRGTAYRRREKLRRLLAKTGLADDGDRARQSPRALGMRK